MPQVFRKPSDKPLSRQEVYSLLKENKDTWYTTEELAIIVNNGSNELARMLVFMMKQGLLIKNEWIFIMTPLGRRRIRRWKADLD